MKKVYILKYHMTLAHYPSPLGKIPRYFPWQIPERRFGLFYIKVTWWGLTGKSNKRGFVVKPFNFFKPDRTIYIYSISLVQHYYIWN